MTEWKHVGRIDLFEGSGGGSGGGGGSGDGMESIQACLGCIFFLILLSWIGHC